MFEKSVLTYCRGLDVEDFLRPNEQVKSEIATLSDKIIVLKASIADIESKLKNIMEAIESGAKFEIFAARAAQLQSERTHVDGQLRAAQQKYERYSTKEIDIREIHASIDDLLQRMAQLSGNDLYDLRAALSQQVKTLIARIAAYPGGYIEKPKFIKGLREHLSKEGHDQAEIDEHISKKFKTEPNPDERFFTLISHNASIRMIRPDKDDPEILHLEMPEQNVKDNLNLHVDGIRSMMGTFKYISENKIILKGN